MPFILKLLQSDFSLDEIGKPCMTFMMFKNRKVCIDIRKGIPEEQSDKYHNHRWWKRRYGVNYLFSMFNVTHLLYYFIKSSLLYQIIVDFSSTNICWFLPTYRSSCCQTVDRNFLFLELSKEKPPFRYVQNRSLICTDSVFALYHSLKQAILERQKKILVMV